MDARAREMRFNFRSAPLKLAPLGISSEYAFKFDRVKPSCVSEEQGLAPEQKTL
jgi:hypothetical protein